MSIYTYTEKYVFADDNKAYINGVRGSDGSSEFTVNFLEREMKIVKIHKGTNLNYARGVLEGYLLANPGNRFPTSSSQIKQHGLETFCISPYPRPPVEEVDPSPEVETPAA
ncbi:hypothetical protein KAR91_33245 [Candidatus Pacearchaeota archaeon]|nr:hypothetical protein [Candidatus Pacearchaeota archaeon]